MLWYDTGTNTLKMRAEANDAWINVAYLDQSTDAFRILDDTQVVNTSGTQTGLLGDQSTATWQAGAGTTQSLVSPANVKASVLANAPTYSQSTATGAVGTYGFFKPGILPGQTRSGSNLSYTDVYENSGSPSPAGTWRCMGHSTGGGPTVYVRIS
jgi:hypothetical protein